MTSISKQLRLQPRSRKQATRPYLRPLAGAIATLLLAGSSAVSLAQEAAPKTQDDLLKKIETLGAAPKKEPLGNEGTPVAGTMAETPRKKSKGETIITSDEATFDQKKRVAVFIKNVEVQHPEFTVICDRLTAFLKPESGAPAADPPPAANPNAGPKSSGGGLDTVIAEANPGKMVTVTQKKLEADGSSTTNIGRGRKVTYDEKTGNIVLTGSPSVLQQGINLHVAEAEDTVMTLNRGGDMHTEGPNRTVIKDSTGLDTGR